MQVFNAFFKVLKKKLPSSIIYLIVFLAISFPLAMSAKPTVSFEENRLNVAVFDKDGTDESKALVRFIGTKHDLVDTNEDKDELMDKMYYGVIDYALVIEKGYSEKIKNEDFDDLFSDYKLHDSYEAVLMGQFLNEYVTSLRSYVVIGESVKTAIKKTEDTLNDTTEVTYATFDEEEMSDYGESFAYYFQYLPYVLMCVIINALCPTLMTLKSKEIRYRTNCSPLRSSATTIQTFIASAICVLVIWIVFIGAGMIMYGGMYRGRAWYAVLNSFIFVMIITMLAAFIANIAKKQETVNIITQIISLGMSFLCGVFVPQFLLGKGVLAAAHFLPAYWYIKVNNMLSGVDTYDHDLLITCLLVQVGFAVALGALALVVNRVVYQGGVKKKVNMAA